MRIVALLIITLLIGGGCSTIPFQEPAQVSLVSTAPQAMVERFRETLPESFQLLNSIVFEYNYRKFTGIGYVTIDRRDGVFKVVCLNPMGVKLFELSGDQNTVTDHFTIAAFARYGDIASAVGNDIRRIYFDLLPAATASAWKRTYEVRYRQPSGSGLMEYVFAGAEGDLVQKNYYDDHGIVWRVLYYEYAFQNGKRLPRGIVFMNYQYGYRLTVREKEFNS